MNLFRLTLSIFATSLCALPLTGFSQDSELTPETARPNILFIFADDWGWGDLSCHGHPYIKTPNIDRLAKEGTDFTNFTVASGVCSPSRAAVLTGLFPARFGINGHFATAGSNKSRGMPDWLDQSVPNIPRLLQSAGYMTGHFGKWHLTGSHISDAPRPELYGYDRVGAYNTPGELMPVHDDAKLTIEMIEECHKTAKPFFINMWVHEPHTPFHTVQEYQDMFPEQTGAHNVYASVLAHADARIGEVLNALDRLEIADNTLVIFSSDNGPETGGRPGRPLKTKYDPATGSGYNTSACVGTTGGRKGRKRSNFQGGVGVPFIARWPEHIAAGAKDSISWISAVDLLPTFLSVAGIQPPTNLQVDGVDIQEVLKGTPLVERDTPLYWRRFTAGGKKKGRVGEWAVLQGKWKLLTDNLLNQYELYDLSVDPTEQKDVSEGHAEVVSNLLDLLRTWQETLPNKIEDNVRSKADSKK